MGSRAISAAGQQHLALVKTAKLAHRPLDDAAAAQKMLVFLQVQLPDLTGLQEGQRLSGKGAVLLINSVTAALHIVGWLVMSRKNTMSMDDDNFWAGVNRGMLFVYNALNSLEVGVELLKPALQPAAALQVPAFTTWVPALATGVVQWCTQPLPAPAPSTTTAEASAAVHDATGKGFPISGYLLVVIWRRFYMASLDYSRRWNIAATTWLPADVVQLAEVLLLQDLFPSICLEVFDITLTAARGATRPMGSPQICAIGGAHRDAAVGAQVAALLQQGFWWRALATCCQCITTVTPRVTAQWHPRHHCLPDFTPYAFNDHMVASLQGFQGLAYLQAAHHVLLVRLLWDLWPWQLRQLQARDRAAAASAAAATAAAVAGAAAAAGAVAGAAAAAGAAAGAAAAAGCVQDVASTSCPTSTSSQSGDGQVVSSSSSTALSAQHLATASGTANTPSVVEPTGVYMDWPLLPPQGVPLAQQGQEPQPVTLQQLQLAMCGLAYANRTGAPTAALHVALLLQQADPGLRAEFLEGPGGTSLLAACQYWGYRGLLLRKPARPGEWKNFALLSVVNGDCGFIFDRMWGALVGEDIGGGSGWPAPEVLPAPTSVGMVLGWCYLQLPLGREQQQQPLPQQQQQQQQQQEKEEEQKDVAYGQGPGRYRLVTTPFHADMIKQTGCGQECLPLQAVPSTALRFAPGCAPTPLLLGTLEALLRAQGPQMELLGTVAAFVHATVVWLQSAPADAQQAGASTTSSSSSSSSSAAGGQTSSSTSSGGTTNNSSSSGQEGTDRGDVLSALASLAVTLRAVLQPVMQCVSAEFFQYQPLEQAKEWLVVCCSVAGSLLHLAAQQLAVPGPQVLPALQLAAAAQQLGAACANKASHCEIVVSALQHIATNDYFRQQAQKKQPGRHPHPDKVCAALKGALHALHDGLMALQQVQPWWQQGAADQGQQEDSTQSAAVEAGTHKNNSSSSSGSGSSGASSSSGTGSCGVSESSSGVSSSSSSSDSVATKQSPSGGPSLGNMVEVTWRACRLRVQLVGCSHPRCPNLSSPSAEGLVAGRKGVVCGGCRMARYCSPACQKEDWEQHRHACRRLAAAGDAAAERDRQRQARAAAAAAEAEAAAGEAGAPTAQVAPPPTGAASGHLSRVPAPELRGQKRQRQEQQQQQQKGQGQGQQQGGQQGQGQGQHGQGQGQGDQQGQGQGQGERHDQQEQEPEQQQEQEQEGQQQEQQAGQQQGQEQQGQQQPAPAAPFPVCPHEWNVNHGKCWWFEPVNPPDDGDSDA